ncbi:MAG: DMT family transporter [Firmicutes bacterium]|nr:DMT family transporter [Bacillota bacterium]
MKIPKQFYFIFAVLGGATWGTHGTFASLMGQYGISDNTVSMLCPLFYAGFFLILVFKDDIRKLKLSKKYLPVMVLYGLEVAAYNFFIIKAYWHVPVGIVHTIVFCNLFLLMIFSRILFKTPLTRQKAGFALFAVLGVAMLLNVFDAEVSRSAFGIACTLISMAAWAGIVITEKYLLIKELDGNVLMVYSGYIAFALLLLTANPVTAVEEIVASVAVSNGMSLWPLLAYALITSVGSYYFYLLAIRQLEPAICQLGYVADPLVATILGVMVFGQVLMPIQWAGLGLILVVVVAVQLLEVKAERKA